jgi:hypothetical protein
MALSDIVVNLRVQIAAWISKSAGNAARDGIVVGFAISTAMFIAFGLYQVFSHQAAERQNAVLGEARKAALADRLL